MDHLENIVCRVLQHIGANITDEKIKSCHRLNNIIFTNQPNMVIDSGLHSSLQEKYHHKIIYSKLILNIEYPPPYIRKILDYNRFETDSINRSIEIFDLSYLF